MFEQAVIHYPADENDLKQIYKEIAAFRCAAAVKYIETLNLSGKQLEILLSGLKDDYNRGLFKCVTQ